MEVKENIHEVREKLFAKLWGTGWDNILQAMVQSSDFDDILIRLKQEVENGYRFTPVLNDVFKPFELCHLSDTKVVFLMEEPYLYIGIADGLCLSTKEPKPTHALNYMFQEIKATTKIHKSSKAPTSLKKWAEQGVLLLNCTPTTRISVWGYHYVIWKMFTSFLLGELNKIEDLIFVFFGDTCEQFPDIISEKRKVLYVLSPVDLGYFNENKKWNSNNIFNEINKTLTSQNKSQIKW